MFLVVCYGCGEKGIVKERCPKQTEVQEQGKMSWPLEIQWIQSAVIRLKGLISGYVSC